MKYSYLIFWILLFNLVSLNYFSQTILVIGDTSKVRYNSMGKDFPLDSLVTVYDGDKLTYADSYEVYFDQSKKHLAYKSFREKDTCWTINYYREGQLKNKTTYYLQSDGHPVWWFDEQYCSNGQLIHKGPSPNQPGKILFINYYCNGKKKNEYYLNSIGIDGKATLWYENGQVQTEMYYDKGKPKGEWKYWAIDGKLEKVEKYENGELINTK